MRILAIILLLLIVSCSTTSDQKDGQMNEQDKIKRYFTYNPDTIVKLTPKGGKFEVAVTYPAAFDPKKGIEQVTSPIATSIDNALKAGLPLSGFMISVRDKKIDGTEVGSIAITADEVRELWGTYKPLTSTLKPYFRMNEKYQVEMGIMRLAASAKDIVVERSLDNETNDTVIEISFVLEQKTGAQKDALADKRVFEDLISQLVKISFEADQNIGIVRLSATVSEADPRWNESLTLATYEMSRADFEETMLNWDNLRSRIFDEIEYSPIYLLDYDSKSRVESMQFGSETTVSLYNEDSYVKIDQTLGNVEADASKAIRAIFNNYDVDTVTVKVKAKVPAEPGKVSPDGVHQIVHEFLTVTADRATYEGLNATKLTNTQFLYNFYPVYDYKASELLIRSKLFSVPDVYRAIEVEGDSARLLVDACIFTRDKQFSSKIINTKKLIEKGTSDKSVEDDVEELLRLSAKKLIFEIHPPYLEEVTFDIAVIYKDTTGNIIDERSLGELTFIKEAEANYWFQTENPTELKWVDDSGGSLDVDDDEFFCQN